MSVELMRAILADARPDELPDLFRAVSLFEQHGMTPDEADGWRRRIVALLALHRGEAGASQ